MVRRMLEAGGHEVLDASNASSGFELFVGQSPDLVITDILMPGTDGIELITMLRAERPDVPIVAISGGGKCPPDLYLTSSQYLGATRTLPKPFRRSELLSVVDQILAPLAAESD
jgi:CheY-like chemotaxis protein